MLFSASTRTTRPWQKQPNRAPRWLDHPARSRYRHPLAGPEGAAACALASYGFPADAPFARARIRRNPMAWLILGVAVVTEIIWALSLKWAAMHASWAASAVPIILSFVNMGLLALAMKGLPAGTAYAVWTGLGAVGVTIFGTMLFGEKLNGIQIGFITLIIIGVVGTKLFAEA
jgi:quaternary ammonium compound-resistance protein SugE